MQRISRKFWLAGLMPMLFICLGFCSIKNVAGQSDFQSNWQRFDSLSDRELMELKNKQVRYDQMPVERQQILRDLYSEIENHQNRDELLVVMNEYYAWLKTLSESERDKIFNVPPEQRIREIRTMRQIQAERNFGRSGETQLPGKDIAALFQWRAEFVQSKGDQIVEVVSKQFRTERRLTAQRGFELLGRFHADKISEIITAADVQNLRGNLSSDAVRIIEKQTEESDQRKLVARWLIATLRAERTPSKAQILKIIEGLDDDEKLALDRMSESDRMREFTRRYNFGNPELRQEFRDRRRRGSANGRRGGFPRNGPPNSNRKTTPDSGR